MKIESTGELIAKIGTKEVLFLLYAVTTASVFTVTYFKKKCDKLSMENITLKEQLKNLRGQ